MELLPVWLAVQFGWELPSFTSPTEGEDEWAGGHLLDHRGHFISHTVTSWSWAGVLPPGAGMATPSSGVESLWWQGTKGPYTLP